jgi:hypothetical protein
MARAKPARDVRRMSFPFDRAIMTGSFCYAAK